MSKKNKNKNKQYQKPIQETLHEQAALRLKAFIEDLRYDPMFKHRLFYPVLYKEVIRGPQQLGNNDKIQAHVAEVIYEYYLLKMESFSSDKAAQIFQAILLSNGPLLPVTDRFRITDADDGNSLLNPRNRDIIVHRTRTLLTVLQDENLYNFIFRSTVGGNLDNMRQRFKKLANEIHITSSGFKIQDNTIAHEIQIDLKKLKQGKNPVTNPVAKNIQVLNTYFENIRDKDIQDVVSFLIYMGKSRNIITDFSYRPMTQEMLNKFTDYGLSPEDESELEFIDNIESALDSNVLQKDLNSQLDVFIPVLSQEYAAICTQDENKIGRYNLQVGSRSLEQVLKNKLKRTLKQIVDYTRNYLTRKMLSAFKNGEKTFISRVTKDFLTELRKNENRKSIGDLSRELITYENFINSNGTDLNDLIKQIFKNDISYITEVCKKEHIQQLKTEFVAAWDLSNMTNEKKILDEIQNKIISSLYHATSCLDTNIKKIDDVKANLKKLIAAAGEDIDLDSIEIDITHKLNQIFSHSTEYTDETIAERAITSILKNINKLFVGLLNSVLKKPDIYKFTYSVMYYVAALKVIQSQLAGYISAMKSVNDYKDILVALRGIYVISKIGNEVLNTKIKYDSLSKLDSAAYNYIIKNFISSASDCIELNNKISDILDKVPKESDDINEMLKEIGAASNAIDKIAQKINTEPLADHLTEVYFKYYLKPVLINFFGYALDEFEFITRKNDVEADIISKDVLHFSTLLTPSNVGILTFDGAVIQDLAKFTYVLTSDTFSGITYSNPDSVVKFLDEVYGLTYFNVIIYGRNDAYVYMNNIGVPYLYRGAKTKIPIRELRKNYEFLMDPSRGLYKNISLPKKKH